jgi:hypothetical protein
MARARRRASLPTGWVWGTWESGQPAAGLLTADQDCFVYVENGSLVISTGMAPVEVCEAILEANRHG